MFIRVEIAVIPYKLISRSLRSTHFFLVCFVLFLSFPASPSRKVAFRIISCDLLYKFVRAYMCMRIVVVSPSGFICSAMFLSLYLLGTILNNFFLTFAMLTPLIILANSADVHQLEKKLMNSNNKVADQESKWEKFQLFCRGSEN